MTSVTAERYPSLARFADGRRLDQVIVPIHAPKPSKRRGQRHFGLTPGRVNDDAVEFYAYGYCAHLAAAIHEATGWTFALVEIEDSGEWKWNHVGVFTPNDHRVIDIYGTRPSMVAAREQSADKGGRPARIREVTSTRELLAVFGVYLDWADSWWADELDPITADVTRCFADQLIAVDLNVPG